MSEHVCVVCHQPCHHEGRECTCVPAEARAPEPPQDLSAFLATHQRLEAALREIATLREALEMWRARHPRCRISQNPDNEERADWRCPDCRQTDAALRGQPAEEGES